jgi:hypothetical protein
MKPAVKARLSAQVDKLLAEAKEVMRTKFSNSGGNYIDMGDPYVDAQAFQKWLFSCQNLAKQIGTPAKVWVDGFEGTFPNQLVVAEMLLGRLQSLHEAICDDLLTAVDDLITADAFGSLLEQSQELSGKGYSLAAGVLGRAVLEEHLRKLCDRNSCLPSGRPTINDLNQALYKAGALDKLAMQGVTAMATAGNHCSHNNLPALSESDVNKFLRDVSDFLIRNPLS